MVCIATHDLLQLQLHGDACSSAQCDTRFCACSVSCTVEPGTDPLSTQVCGDETEEVAVSGVLCRRISAQTSAPATRGAAGGGAAAAEVAVEIEVPLLAAVVELHTEAIARAPPLAS